MTSRCLSCGLQTLTQTDLEHPQRPGIVRWVCRNPKCAAPVLPWEMWGNPEPTYPYPVWNDSKPIGPVARVAKPSPPTMPVARKAIPRLTTAEVVENKPTAGGPPDLETIVIRACKLLGIEEADVRRDLKQKKDVAARAIIVAAGRVHNYSFPKIVAAMGKSGHSTVIWQYDRFKERENENLADWCKPHKIPMAARCLTFRQAADWVAR